MPNIRLPENNLDSNSQSQPESNFVYKRAELNLCNDDIIPLDIYKLIEYHAEHSKLPDKDHLTDVKADEQS